jgi:hypothetical protein
VTETRTPPLAYRERDVTYDEDALQLHAQAGKTLRWSNGLSGKFSYGVDYLRGKVVNEQTASRHRQARAFRSSASPTPRKPRPRCLPRPSCTMARSA